MWPFKKKEKKWKPKADFDYFLLGLQHAHELRKKYKRLPPPIYTPSIFIQPKQLT